MPNALLSFRHAATAALLLAGAVTSQSPIEVTPNDANASCRLLVADSSGTVTALRFRDDDDPTFTALARIDLGEPLDFLTQPIARDDAWLVLVLGRHHLFTVVWQPARAAFELRGKAPVPGDRHGTHVELAAGGSQALIACYGDAAEIALPLDNDGLSTGSWLVRTGEPSALDLRNAHQTRCDSRWPDFAFVPCLGADAVQALRLPSLAAEATAKLQAGAGPRHLTFHPTLPIAYVLGELDSSVTAFDVVVEPGDSTSKHLPTQDGLRLELRQRLSGLPEGESEASRSSDLATTPDGRFLFALHREPRNEVVGFRIDGDGRLAPNGRWPTDREHARTMSITPEGDRLFTGNTWSASITTFRIDDAGQLTNRQHSAEFGGKVLCVRSF